VLKLFEERITDHGDDDRPEDGFQKRREDSVEEIEKEDRDKKDEDKRYILFSLFTPNLPDR